jgi:putative heme iron utilization protein
MDNNNIANNATFESIINDALLLDNTMISVKNDGAVAEVKLEKGLPFRIREQWATLGDDNGPWHVHINIEETKKAKFITETMANGRNSYSIRFFNSKDVLVLRINFMKMYNQNNELLKENLSMYEDLYTKYGRKDIRLLKKPDDDYY